MRNIANKMWPKSVTIGWALFSILLIIASLDISKDNIFQFLMSYSLGVLPMYFGYASQAVLGLLLAYSFISTGIALPKKALIFICFFGGAYCLGAIVGLIRGNNPDYVLGDFERILIYLTIFSIKDFRAFDFSSRVKSLLAMIAWITIVKILIALLLLTIRSGTAAFGARVLLKFTPLLLFASIFFLAYYLFENKIKYLFLFLFSSIGIFVSQTRGFFIGYIVGFIILYFSLQYKKLRARLLVFGIVAVLFAGLVAVVVFDDIGITLGNWKGENYRYGIDLRLEQYASFQRMFLSSPFFGIGLGGYDPEYRSGVEQEAPYIQELEFPNLLAKFGVLGMGIWLGSMLLLIVWSMQIVKHCENERSRQLVIAAGAGLGSLIFGGLTNPIYSSLYSHMMIVILVLALMSASKMMRNQNLRPIR